VGAVPETVIVVPCYNEAGRLATDAFLAFVRHGETKLLFVDDGSRDGTDAVLRSMVDQGGGRIEALQLPANRGKGAAVQAGLRHAISGGADVVGYLDADLSTPLDELERLIAVRASANVDVVLGSRVGLVGHDVRRSATRHYLGRVFATAASLVLRLQIYDTQCGAKVFRVSPALEHALETQLRTRWVFDLELLVRLRATDPRVALLEVPLRTWHDVGGSKLTVWQMLLAARDLLLLARSASGSEAGVNVRSRTDRAGREAGTR
jgi:dolichyl-phosphate beta-glucosyltransferase